jgi:uncharacterized protein (DUF1800 family)
MSRFPSSDVAVFDRAPIDAEVLTPPASADSRVSQVSDAISKRLVDRMTFGQTPEELALLRGMGRDAYIEMHLHPERISDARLDQIFETAFYAPLTSTPQQLWETVVNPTYDSWRVIRPFVTMTLLRQTFSKRQLFERMVEFWNDHFNTYLYADFNDAVKIVDDRSVARAHAFGRFRDLLLASARSPSMLSYLNNNVSTAEHPNENYGRELLELHAMGVDGGYTQQDVMEVARCFTGWRFHYPWENPALGLQFLFDPTMHDFGGKVIFQGTAHELVIPPGGGEQDAISVIDALASHPSTARFISTKLLKRFWGEQPSPNLVSQIAGVYSATGGNIREVMRAILDQVLSPSTPRKFKRPHNLLISSLRATDTAFTDADSIYWNTYNIGQPLFQWAPPNGYPDAIGYWVGAQLPRWNIGASLMNGEYWTTTFDLLAFLAGARNRDQIIARIVSKVFAGCITDADRTNLTTYLGATPGTIPPRQRIMETIGLALGSPSFQWL